MKVVQLNTYTEGGAAEAALRIHQSVRQEGIESIFLALYKAGVKIEATEDFRDHLPKMNAWIKKFTNKWQTIQSDRIYKKTGELFASLKTVWPVQQDPYILASDIAHLHWIDHYVDIPGFFDQYKGRIVWTLHDHFPFSGGFHYPPAVIESTSQKKTEVQKNILRKLFQKRPVHFVTPSAYLAQLAKDSDVTGKSEIRVIKNPVDTDLFTPANKSVLREKWKIEQDEKVVFFIADHLQIERKGWHILEEALGLLQTKITLLVAGRGSLPPKINNLRVIHAGHVRNKATLVELYNAADVLVNPSLQDISSNTVMEAMACGIPSIVFETGGIPELVSAVNGMVIKEKNAGSLAGAIDDFFKRTFDPVAIRQKALNDHSFKVIGEKYAALYREIAG